MLIIAGTRVGYRITELLTWTVGQILSPDGDIVREFTVTRADLKGGKGRESAVFAAGAWC